MSNGEYVIKHSHAKRDSFGEYEYLIYYNNKLLAKYYHDYRGDDNWITFNDGDTEMWPIGGVGSFLKGGGPEPLLLSNEAIEYLKNKVQD